MKRKGFTLVELLGVLIILALIVLITTPVVTNIIDDAEISSNKRRIDKYENAVQSAVYIYNNKNMSSKLEGTFNSNTVKQKLQEGNTDLNFNDDNFYCDTVEVYENNVYVTDCSVSNKKIDYAVGEPFPYKIYEPNYYWYGHIVDEEDYIHFKDSNGNNILNIDDLDGASISISNIIPSVVSGITFYIGLDVDSNNMVTDAYACFKKDGEQYCLKGYEADEYFDNNVYILKRAFDDSTCTQGTNYECHFEYFDVIVRNNSVLLHNDISSAERCLVHNTGYFWCRD